MRRAATRPITLKQYRDMANRYFELLASGMEKKEAKQRAEAEYRRDVSGAHWITDLERFVAWRLLHLNEEWQEPPREWLERTWIDRMSARFARQNWLRIAKRQYFVDHEAEGAELAVSLGIKPEYFAFEAYYEETGEMKRVVAEIEAQYPDEEVCKELLIQHHNAIAGIEAPKQLPSPPLMIDQPAIPVGAIVA